MKRRRALEILGVAAGTPLVAPSGAMGKIFDWGQRVWADAEPNDLRTLTAEQARTVTALAEVIFPRTDTPGATDADVTAFVDTLLTGWLEEEDRDRFLAGIDEVDAEAKAEWGSPFADGSEEQQVGLATALDDEVEAARQDDSADEQDLFFYDMKRFTLSGYFTSQVGLRAIGHRIVFRTFEGCVPVEETEAP